MSDTAASTHRNENTDTSFVGFSVENTEYNGAKTVVDAELNNIQQRRNNVDDLEPVDKNNLSGIALSGGGIRSASFCLGVVQSLAKHNLLKKFEYLSTVSGGGYIGGALSWLWLGKRHNGEQKKQFGLDKNNFPYGTGSRYSNSDKKMDTNQAKLMRHLRQHGSYLTPGNGITALSLLSILLRGMAMGFVTLIVLASFFAQTLFVIDKTFLTAYPTFTLLNIGLTVSGLYVVGLLSYGLLAVVLRGSHSAYLLRRCWEILIKSVLIVAGIFLLLALIHYLYGLLNAQIESISFTSFVGAVIAWFSQKSKKVSFLKVIPKSVLVYLGVLLMFIGLFVVSEFVAIYFREQIATNISLEMTWVYHALGAIGILIIAFLTPINKVSIHRYYRDRLMETFNPDIDSVLSDDVGDSKEVALAFAANKASLHDCLPNDDNPMPYHIINANVILVDSKIPKFKGRGGDNFILSPLYSGSNATGWRKSETFADGSMTLPSAVAISGAAANSNSGVAGSGLTMNPLISKLMSIFNIRLGYWTANPALRKEHFLFNSHKTTPNFLNPGIKSVLNLTKLNEEADFVQLSDGGHFENLAVYELIRRRCKTIICCDAEQDNDFVFESLANLIEKARVDFGVKIDVSEKDLDMLKYSQDDKGEIKFAKQGYICVDIIYPAQNDNGKDNSEERGKFIFIKTTLPENLPADVMGYKYKNTTFPDESTADQFFDEKRMEAYRMLGMCIGESVINDNVI